jgi:hypothetical protein
MTRYVMVARASPSTRHKPLTWTPLRRRDGRLVGAMVRCANGHLATLTDHRVNPIGQVSPSVECPNDGCSFHVSIQLVGWEEAMVTA